MPSMNQQVSGIGGIESAQQHQKVLLFFKCYLRCLKQLISGRNSLREEPSSIFDLKKTSGHVSLEPFLQRVFSYFKCGAEAYICALGLIDRLAGSQAAQSQNMTVSIKNIFKVFSLALLIATKNFDDFYYSNAYYARVCGLSLQQLNMLEKEFLKMIDFDVFIDSDEYKIYEQKINKYQADLLDEISGFKNKQNSIGEKNTVSQEKKKNKCLARPNCNQTPLGDQTNTEVQVAA